MKTEIWKGGPISCGIHVSDEFRKYNGGIFEDTSYGNINHEIVLVGYGVDADTGKEYWVGRNSWGTYWGEQGYFKILMGKNIHRIEEDCQAGTPSFEKPTKKEAFIE